MANGWTVGVVVIGRNEGPRLARCLDSVLCSTGILPEHVVYVDSGSHDGSPELARARGVDVIVLEAPFTAARGRNAGFEHLATKHRDVAVVQFVDGDTEYESNWMARAAHELAGDPAIAAVTGVLRERHPEHSVYNLLCDVEWNGVTGDIDTFGGNVMIRVDALQAAGIYNPDLIAGEDPELAVRMRKATGRRIVRVEAPMCLHDVAMTQFSQWWRRNVRAGHAFAEVNRMHGEAPLFFWRHEVRSNWVWGAGVPLAAVLLAPSTSGGSLAGASVLYAVLFARVYHHARRRGLDPHAARLFSFFITLGKVPQALGQAKYWWHRVRGVRSAIIEYKKPAARTGSV